MKLYGDIIPQFSFDIKLFRKRFPNSFSHEKAGAAKAAPAIFSQQPKPPSWHRSCQMPQKLKRMVLSSLVVCVSRGRVYCNPFVTILQPTNYGKATDPAIYSGLFSPVSRNCLHTHRPSAPEKGGTFLQEQEQRAGRRDDRADNTDDRVDLPGFRVMLLLDEIVDARPQDKDADGDSPRPCTASFAPRSKHKR